MRHRTVALPALLASALIGVVIADSPADAGVPANRTMIPTLREWTAGAGSYTFGAATRILVDATSRPSGVTFAADLRDLTGRTVPVVTGATARTGDIRLSGGSTDTQLGTEGYRLTVGASITVDARTDTGAFYGTRSLLQLIKQSPTIPAGTGRDWPSKAERGLMVDNGRKFFTAQWLRNHVKDLAYLKLNYLHLHFSDNLGFRIESSSHPEIVSAQRLTKRELADLISLAAQYHVTIVPEIDFPGHMDTILAAHPDLKLVSGSGTVNHGFIDLANERSYTLMRDLIDEYLPLFPGPFWHLGADEYVTNYSAYPQLLTYARAHYGPTATAKDTYYGFINWANAIVRAGGKTMRMWNDGIRSGDGTVTPAPTIVVDHWTNSGLTPQQLAGRGHQLMNSAYHPTYYVLGGPKPDVTFLYEAWNPDLFEGGTTITDPTRNSGAAIHVWCDSPNAETEEQIAAGIRDSLRGLAQQTWGTPKAVATYAAFRSMIVTIGRAPGYPTAGLPGDLAAGKPTRASSVETPAFPAAYATDGEAATRWSSAYTDAEWLQVDLGAAQSIRRVILRWETAYGRAYRLQTSDDGSTWTTVHATSSGDGGVDDVTGLTAHGRYLRMQGVARGTGWGYSLWALEAYA
ncbi:family 20 glycosylhydrolase [Couchioplanes caeruleus]|uniref:Beta-N-acetylhexosaminidase n=2 Tax=Couchioplanes caeruleus TaxID=56438 RepID=A0A1K0FZS3_9ACTN|nr:family 20 glycosylhydrolase [Couchioplanes caeruleus]OJF10562.1 beta-N-acetylhexosaminidase [Couchioplanes caeruleus subsp. caeruleus]ROP28657.1 hexosaminidase [Couchioplanes caeruleus]